MIPTRPFISLAGSLADPRQAEFLALGCIDSNIFLPNQANRPPG